ncbi:MAG: hypothetical protein ABSF49_07640 [Roseiarcus sp.]|jgi:hypothetical protein|uniref:hypothetical protein n=1 Tax=Roseiarcus sp. TaxID=1969460 RepID=UPI003C2A0024
MRTIGWIGLAALSGLFAAGSAEAAESGFIARFLGVEPSKTAEAFACFNRIYDPAHLAQHPQQNVKTMTLLAVVDPANADEVQLRFGVTFRTRKGMLETNGGCATLSGEGDAAASATTVHCNVDCDGGAIDVTLKTDGNVLIGIPAGARLWKPGDDNPEDNVHGAFGPDDKLFRVDRAALGECLPLAVDKDERARLTRGR